MGRRFPASKHRRSQLGDSLREIRDAWGVTHGGSDGRHLAPESRLENGIQAQRGTWPQVSLPEAGMLAAHDATVTESRKTPTEVTTVGKLVKQRRLTAHAASSLGELPETARPPRVRTTRWGWRRD